MDADDILMHYGKLGMKWGKRTKRTTSTSPTEVQVKIRPGKKLKTSGGEKHLPTDEAIKAAILRQKAKKSKVDSLTNKELQDVVQRMNLERQYESLKYDRTPVLKFLRASGKQQASAVNTSASQRVASAMRKKGS